MSSRQRRATVATATSPTVKQQKDSFNRTGTSYSKLSSVQGSRCSATATVEHCLHFFSTLRWTLPRRQTTPTTTAVWHVSCHLEIGPHPGPGPHAELAAAGCSHRARHQPALPRPASRASSTDMLSVEEKATCSRAPGSGRRRRRCTFERAVHSLVAGAPSARMCRRSPRTWRHT